MSETTGSGKSGPPSSRPLPVPRRARSLSGVIGLTALGALLPGTAFFILRRRVLAAAVSAAFVVLVVTLGYVLVEQRPALLRLLVQTRWLTIAVAALAVCFAAWVGVVVASDLLSRPGGLRRRQRAGATAFTVLVCLVLAVPFAVAARYATAQREFIDDVFASAATSKSATRPVVADEHNDPWLGHDRVNVLLLGGDVSVDQAGTRTDSIILASIDVSSGATVLIGLPRNLEHVPFPAGSRLHKLYPDGFTGPGDPLEWMLNAVYLNVPALHPHVLGETDNEGADALKLAVSGALGIPVDYYLLVSIPGFIELVDAMGGVTVNINHPVPIGGVEGVREPEGYLEPGPDQHLDGYHALWFARGRYGLDDYDRMRRQRCLVAAVIDRADPITLLTRYQRILEAGRHILRTDIPAEMLPAFVDLGFAVKDARVRSVVFERGDKFTPEAADFEWMQLVAARATGATERAGGHHGGAGNSPADSADSCAYRPRS